MNRRWIVVLTACVALWVVAGCSSVSSGAPDTANELLPTSPATTTTTEPTTTTTSDPPPPPPCGPADPANFTNSLRPLDTLPPPGEMPADSFMAEIAKSGALRAGVDENTLPLSFRDSRTSEFRGFEIDLLHEIARAIVGDEGQADIVQHIPVITDEKVDVVEEGDVDLTASAVSITCGRWEQVLFTIPYFVAKQKLMVRTDERGRLVLADGTSIDDPATTTEANRIFTGRRVCATAGSTSAGVIESSLPAAEVVEVPTRTDCLKALQNGSVDAILLHDTFLLGFQEQDPNTAILELPFGEQHYGIAIGKSHPELVRFVNRVLLDMRADGRLELLYDEHFAELEEAPETMPVLPPPAWID